MLAVHGYFNGIGVGTARVIGRGGKLSVQGRDHVTDEIFCRGNLKKIHELFPWGEHHPLTASYPDFYVFDIGGYQEMPANGETVSTAQIEYEGVLDVTTRPHTIKELLFYDEQFWPANELTNAPTLTGVPGRPSYIGNIKVKTFKIAFERRYTTKTLPSPLTFNGNGTLGLPADLVTPTLPAFPYAWATLNQLVYNWPNGWVLAHRNTDFLRLSNGVAVPIYDVSESWIYSRDIDLLK